MSTQCLPPQQNPDLFPSQTPPTATQDSHLLLWQTKLLLAQQGAQRWHVSPALDMQPLMSMAFTFTPRATASTRNWIFMVEIFGWG
ncbi:uncharacterized protein MYCGRDRAFT_81397 [Zymoseptoria tritici IPO323]|uniref:Uncharacterized protein n=1 Tax=Zymoseptoria tritici (strain CBS 115943 / IPO323) TaxID=336722 RepID=F9XGE9_ZYMTI|nr:uncharacterized protein MYCGRDRAFT_81397 [Zymoseptoria tritici IPO323]EGP86277.1 hypothetical protein MYCGRDRAFT_81397 [Zymoseptoria tritici IPO323]